MNVGVLILDESIFADLFKEGVWMPATFFKKGIPEGSMILEVKLHMAAAGRRQLKIWFHHPSFPANDVTPIQLEGADFTCQCKKPEIKYTPIKNDSDRIKELEHKFLGAISLIQKTGNALEDLRDQICQVVDDLKIQEGDNP